MSDQHALSEIIDELENLVDEDDADEVRVRDIVEKLGQKSFVSVMLIFSLIATSPASAIPGVTAMVGGITVLLSAQMLAGRDHLWLPDFLMRRRLGTGKLQTGIKWLRRPVRFVERFLKHRLTFLFHRPVFYAPLLLVMALALFMPVMELVPMSGSIAAAVIALFAAGVLTRDGVLLIAALVVLTGLPFAIWQLGFA